MIICPVRRYRVLIWSIFLLIAFTLVACGPAVGPDLTDGLQDSQPVVGSSTDAPSENDEPPPNDAPTEAAGEAVSEAPTVEPIVIDVEAVELASNDLELGFTADGHPYMGDPSAPIIIKEFSDFQCPFCARFYEQSLSTIEDELIAEGEAVLIFYDFPLTSIHPQAAAAVPLSPEAHSSARGHVI